MDSTEIRVTAAVAVVWKKGRGEIKSRTSRLVRGTAHRRERTRTQRTIDRLVVKSFSEGGYLKSSIIVYPKSD